ncbi:MAG: C4-dicarboxylate ABC transporter substrate-binding protein [Rhodospirillaceae bacterium]|nr:C4-dicarboxylate ABC transporter substrate-binding protein [Rhodospirillaceae bacterium]
MNAGKRATRLLSVFVGAWMVLSGVDAHAAAKFHWQMQSLWQAGTINQKLFEAFCDRVKTMTDGRLEITPLPVGAVVAYNETLDAISAGLLDGHQSGSGYFAGKDPAFALLADLNGGYESARQMEMWLYYGGGLELARELYAKYNIYYVAGVWWGVESIPAKMPIRTVEDFKGVKIRSPEGMGQEIFKAIGAAPVNIPGSEVYTALERGVIDATDWGTLSMNQDLGYHKIAPYPLYPGFHSTPMAEIAVNMDRWNELPDDIKAIVEAAARDFGHEMYLKVGLEDDKAAHEAEAEGVELVDWSSEERRKFREVAAGVWKTYAERSEMAQRIYDSHMAFLTTLGLLGPSE